jgi:hypothetical protein
MIRRQRTWTLFVLLLETACSSDTELRKPAKPAMTEDARPPKPAADSGTANPNEPEPTQPAPTSDAEMFTGIAVEDDSLPLQARVQVNGGKTPCGTCSVLLAQAQGGKQPYTYRWSDPELSGAGPHQVCPDEPTDYSVTVTDDSEVKGAEFSTPAQTATATGKVECTPPDLDAGQGTTEFVGCMTPAGMMASGMMATAGTSPEAGAGTITCETGDGGFYSGTGMIPMPLLAGHTYSLSYDQLVPIVIGEPVIVDVYGSNEPCKLEEKFATWTLDGTWHHPGCFTPTKNYDYLLIRVYVGFTLFYFELLNGATFCAGCSEPQP